MSAPESELPFVNKLEEIAGETLSRRDKAMRKDDQRDTHVSTLIQNLNVLKTEAILPRNIAPELVDGIGTALPASEVVSDLLINHSNSLEGWSDPDRRYLLDLAFGKEIVYWQTMKKQKGMQQFYYGSEDTDTSMEDQAIERLQDRQEQLRERITPSMGEGR